MPLMGRMEEMGAKLEAGTYAMECTGIREDQIENSPFGDGRVYKLLLETTDVVDEDGKAIQLEAMATRKLTPQSKMTGWLQAFGIGFSPGLIDLEEIIGRRCLAKILVKETANGEFNRVDDLMPMPRSQTATRRVLAPSETDKAQEEHYHPAAEPGEPIVDASEPLTGTVVAASQQALDYIDRLLADVGIDGREMRQELDIAVPMNVDDAKRAVVWLEEKKKAAAGAKP